MLLQIELFSLLFSDNSLLMYRNTTDLGVLILYPAALLDLLIKI